MMLDNSLTFYKLSNEQIIPKSRITLALPSCIRKVPNIRKKCIRFAKIAIK